MSVRTSTTKRRSVRARIIARDGMACYMCGIDCVLAVSCHQNARTLTLDHVVPVKHGGTDDESNLRVCCAECNGKKADAIPEAYWWRLMASLARWEFAQPRVVWL